MRIKSIRACALLLLSGYLIAIGTAQASAKTAVVVGGTGSADATYISRWLVGYDKIVVVPYPATVAFPSYDHSVDVGKDHLRHALDVVDDDEIVVYGFSQGARIAGDVLTEPQKPGVEGVLYSDPRQAGAGIETQLPFNLPGAAMSGEREGFAVPVESHCIESDGVCDWSNADPVGSIVGYLKVHTKYFP